jgi:hypothetical protein
MYVTAFLEFFTYISLAEQPDWTYDATHPAQYWSGPSENGTNEHHQYKNHKNNVWRGY